MAAIRLNPLKAILPLAMVVTAVAGWEVYVRLQGIPPYILPAPSLIAATLGTDWPLLWASLLATF